MPTLTELCNQFGTDKGTALPDWHAYSEVYEEVLAPFRERPVTLLEIGIHQGASLRAWRAWFPPETTIAGMDNDANACANANAIPGVYVYPGDQGTTSHLHLALSDLGPPDIVIDDAGHEWAPQQACFEFLFPCLNSGGIYAIEDVETDSTTRGGFAEWQDTKRLSFAPDCGELIAECRLVPSRYPGRWLILCWRK